ncbi:MAG: MFS transporter [Desulfonatronovibrio sp. MSAO_Bac4]|nr:MAG: MFS transporter [Desulfonatronovibrio sp. MSAO_Bac4]
MFNLQDYLATGNKRWVVVAGAIFIQFCLGSIYAWSAFTGLLTKPSVQGGEYGFTAQQAAWIFSIGLLFVPLCMISTGRLLTKFGPRAMALAGGVVLGTGYILGGLFGSTFWTQLIFIGVVGGSGIGLAYVVPISVGIKWFPDKKGLISGIAVAGFGFGATLWVKMAGSWFGGLLYTVSLFSLPGVQSVFLIYGITFLLFIGLGSLVMVNPPQGYVPQGYSPSKPDEQNNIKPMDQEFSTLQMLGKPQFYILWIMFFSTALAGLMVIYSISLFGIDALQAANAVEGPVHAAAIAGTAMAWYAIFNGLGRVIWGGISDRLGRKWSIFVMSSFQAFILLVFFEMGSAVSSFILAAAIIGFNFGGNFALFPAITADYFGSKNLGANYGWMFLAFGIAGIAGPQIAGYFKDIAGAGEIATWSTSFTIAGIACIFAAVLSLFLKPPSKLQGPKSRVKH